MNDKTGGNRGLRDAGALAVAAAVAVLATAFGGGSAPSANVPEAAYTQGTLVQYVPFIGQLEQKVRQARQEEARVLPELRTYFQCVRSHGGPR